MTAQSRRERFEGFEIEWSIDVQASTVELSYAVHAAEEVFVSDRLWDQDDRGERAPDPFGVYRFVRDGSLRLVFAQAPHVPDYPPAIYYAPLFSRVMPGEAHRRSIQIALPVVEYSSLSRGVDGEAALEEVFTVKLVMGYRLRSSLDADPEPPINETAEEAGYITYVSGHAISSMQVGAIKVLRRTGYMARFPLPGEPPPEPHGPLKLPAPEEKG